MLVRRLVELGFDLIDCQTHSNHLESLGAEQMPREDFLNYLQKNDRRLPHHRLTFHLPILHLFGEIHLSRDGQLRWRNREMGEGHHGGFSLLFCILLNVLSITIFKEEALDAGECGDRVGKLKYIAVPCLSLVSK